MRIFKKVGRYEQMLEVDEDGGIMKATCTCKFSSINPNNWENGGMLCKHIIEVLDGERKNPRQKQ